MDQSNVIILVVAFLVLLAVFVTVASILILTGGSFYNKIPEKSRPRRWMIGIFFSYFVVFCVWCPVRSFYPGSSLSHVLNLIFGAFTFFIVAWYVLGRVRGILLPLIVLLEWMADAYKNRSGAKRP